MPAPLWTRPTAETAADDLADALASSFGIERPEVRDMRDVFPGWYCWEWSVEARGLATPAGAAELCATISPTFAHLYFRFFEPSRALACGFGDLRRLNTASGKWNRWTSPESDPDLSDFVTGCRDDFRRAAGTVPATPSL